MTIKPITPRKAVKELLRFRPKPADIDAFKERLAHLLNNRSAIEREENQKSYVRDLLRDAWYAPAYEVNTKGDIDLAIHIGPKPGDKVGVLIEAKRPGSAEMMSAGKPNTKAMQQLVLYYLRERIDEDNTDIRYCIATDINEWFIFDAAFFQKKFAENSALVKEYKRWAAGQKVTDRTADFYAIAARYIDALDEELPCIHFDLREFSHSLDGAAEPDGRLIALYKLLSPHFLLRTPFADDSNKLNERFYKELLYILGLEERKEGSKTLIDRCAPERRHPGSLVENAMDKLDDRLRHISNRESFGSKDEEQMYHIALELSLTWINRILFLKLLEGQLVAYHGGAAGQKFLNNRLVQDYDELFQLFHRVLARTVAERPPALQEKYAHVPYLNSSLFELTTLEEEALNVSALNRNAALPLMPGSVLTAQRGAAIQPADPLDYLFRFLDAYDFASEDTEGELRSNSRQLINASVLGKVFEKINGYKDGSIYTPGFITTYMCRQAIRPAVMQKFSEHYGKKLEDWEHLKNLLADHRTPAGILTGNRIINSLHICDPAVGSGHFLVSALNELIAIKAELGLLADEKGTRFSAYELAVVNDELLITDASGAPFRYNARAVGELQRFQEALFHEKQTIIESCLFGVDINPNSVNICRLRLWIELLKHAYYRADGTLETLPNIDINIKAGNSLLSRFPLDTDLTEAFKKQQYNITTYKNYIASYRHSRDRVEKATLRTLIDRLKTEYTQTIHARGPERQKVARLRGQLLQAQSNMDMFGEAISTKQRAMEEKRIGMLLDKALKELEAAEEGALYRNALEWRYEFPEVLDEEGNYIGFDVVIGNPPYISAIDLKKALGETDYVWLKKKFKTAKGTTDLFIYFFEKGLTLLKDGGLLGFITPNRYLSAGYGEALRKYLVEGVTVSSIVDYSDVKVFQEAMTYPVVTFLKNEKPAKDVYTFSVGKFYEGKGIISEEKDSSKLKYLQGFVWGYLLNNKLPVAEKVINQSDLLPSAATINATSTAAEAELYHELINENREGFKLINTGTIDPYESLWGKFPLTDKGERYIEPFLKRDVALISNNRLVLYSSPKIIIAKIAISTEAFFDEAGEYSSINTNCLHSFKPGYHPKYVLAWLNCRLFQYVYECYFEGLKMAGGYLLYTAPNLSKMPIKRVDISLQMPVIDIVSQIQTAKALGQDTTDLDSQIDKLIYQLYGLSEEEIALVEG